MFQYTNIPVFLLAKKFAESQPKKETPAKKEKAPKDAGKQPHEKKEKKKEEKAAPPAEEMDECDAALASEPKTKDPFAHLPKRYMKLLLICFK